MFIAAVVDSESGVLRHIMDGGLPPAERLSIYRNNFFHGAISALSLTYPGVRKLLGRECFEAIADQFVRASPPRIAWLDEYGADFPDFLLSRPSLSAISYLGDVARLEWFINRALHADDRPPLDHSALCALDETLASGVRLVAHPSFSLLQTSSPADQILAAVLNNDDAEMGAVDLDSGPTWLVIHRRDGGISVRRLEEMAWRFADRLRQGARLDDASQLVAGNVDELLAAHLSSGHFSSFSIDQDLDHHGRT